jgi:hypothetical protein
MKRTLVVVAAVVGFAAAAGASTLTVFTTNAANVPTNTFNVGDTILLKLEGTATGTDNGIQVGLNWGGNTTALPFSSTMGGWLAGALPPPTDGGAIVVNGTAGSPQGPIVATDTSVVSMIADAIGVSTVTYQFGSVLDFFGIYEYPPGGAVQHSFTVIVPEPATAGLIGLGLLGLVLGGRRRA